MIDDRQLTLGRHLRDRGKDAVESRDGFVPRLRVALQAYSVQWGDVTNDDARRLADELGLKAAHKNQWGAIFRGKGWRHVGWRPSTWPTNHAHLNRVWRYVEEEG